MMTALHDHCPHCGQLLRVRHGVELSPRLREIYDAIKLGGKWGIEKDRLITEVYGPHKDPVLGARTLRVQIYKINEIFELLDEDIRIVSTGRCENYRLCTAKEAAEYKRPSMSRAAVFSRHYRRLRQYSSQNATAWLKDQGQ